MSEPEPSSESKGDTKECPWKCPLCRREGLESGADAVFCPLCPVNIQVICAACAMTSSHDSHFSLNRPRVLPEIHGDKVEEIKTLVASSREVVLKFESAIADVENMEAGLKDKQRELTLLIEQHYEQQRRLLEEQKKSLLAKLKDIEEKKLAHLDNQRREFYKRKEALQRGVEDGKDVCENFTRHAFFVMYDELKKRLEEQIQEHPKHLSDPCENDIVNFEANQELLQQLQSVGYNGVGRVYADTRPDQFKLEGLESAHFVVDHKEELTLAFHDIVGTQLPDRHHNIQAMMTPDEGGPSATCKVENLAGKYKLSFIPRTQGRHSISIRVSSEKKRAATQQTVATVSPLLDFREVRQIPIPNTPENKPVSPWGIAVSRDEDQKYVVISDLENNQLIVFDRPDFTVCKCIGKKGYGEVEFQSPRGLAFTATNSIIVVDKDNHRVQEVTLDGAFERFFGDAQRAREHLVGNEPGQFFRPTAVVLNAKEEVFITDTENLRVQYFRPDGTHLGMIDCTLEATIGSVPSLEVRFKPYAISLHVSSLVKEPRAEIEIETLYVTDREKCLMQSFQVGSDAKANYKAICRHRACRTRHQVSGPCVGGIAVHPTSGFIFVAELLNKKVSIFSRPGRFLASSDPTFDAPMCIAFIGLSQALVTDCHSSRLHLFDIPYRHRICSD